MMMENALFRAILLAFALGLTLALAPAYANEPCQNEGKPVRKQCDCVRKSGSGFPYIETRKAECRTYRDTAGRTCRVDCPNCYAICLESPPTS